MQELQNNYQGQRMTADQDPIQPYDKKLRTFSLENLIRLNVELIVAELVKKVVY